MKIMNPAGADKYSRLSNELKTFSILGVLHGEPLSDTEKEKVERQVKHFFGETEDPFSPGQETVESPF